MSAVEAARALEHAGFVASDQKGSHRHFADPITGDSLTTVPTHPGDVARSRRKKTSRMRGSAWRISGSCFATALPRQACAAFDAVRWSPGPVWLEPTPRNFSMFSSLRAFIAGEWDGISQAPVFVVAALLLSAAAAGWIVRYVSKRRTEIYQKRIEACQERQRAMDEHLREFERALVANSPGDALVKIGELTATVSALSIGRWPIPTREQSEILRARLHTLPPGEVHIRVAYDARALGRALGTILEELGWRVRGSKWMGGDSGISVYPRSAAAEAIAEALRDGAGLEVTVRDNMPTRPLTVDIGEKPW